MVSQQVVFLFRFVYFFHRNYIKFNLAFLVNTCFVIRWVSGLITLLVGLSVIAYFIDNGFFLMSLEFFFQC